MSTEVAVETFEVGDVVQLKSGGPLMTVQYIEPPDYGYTQPIRASWVSEYGFGHGQYAVKALKKIPLGSVWQYAWPWYKYANWQASVNWQPSVIGSGQYFNGCQAQSQLGQAHISAQSQLGPSYLVGQNWHGQV